MDKEQLKQFIIKTIDEKLNSPSNMVTPSHTHNSYDVNQLDPAIALLGFPVIQPVDNDATIVPSTRNPNDIPQNGTFRFYVDTTPRYRLWAYLVYQNTSGALVGAWKVIALA